MAILKGIDVSYAQGYLPQSNWNSIKSGSDTAPPMDFAIIKATQGRELPVSEHPQHTPFEDPQFANNISCASNTSLMLGVYHYFTATTVSEAEEEADKFIEVTEPYRNNINLWYSIDIEQSEVLLLDNTTFYNVVMAFIDKLDALSLPVMLYGGDTMFYKFGTRLSYIVSTYAVWYARWWEDSPTWTYPSDGTDRPGVNGRIIFNVDGQPYSDYKIWQFGKTNSTYVAGVHGNVDVNFGYFDEPPSPPTPPPLPYSDEIVFHKVLDTNLPNTAPNEKQHVYFTASSENPDSANLYISRKSDRNIIPVSGGGSSAGVSSIGGKTGAITLDRGLSIDDSKVLRGPDLSGYLTSADAQNTYAPKATNGYVEKVSVTSTDRRVPYYSSNADGAYYTTTGGDGTVKPEASGVLPVMTTGRIRVNDPVGDYHAVNKKYVDDGFVTKLTGTSAAYNVYAFDNTGDTSLPVLNGTSAGTAEPISSNALVRCTNGRIRVATPIGPYHAATKKYVDDAIESAIGNAIGGSY